MSRPIAYNFNCHTKINSNFMTDWNFDFKSEIAT